MAFHSSDRMCEVEHVRLNACRKGKLYGFIDVEETNGDSVCENCVALLQMRLKFSKDHKQRIQLMFEDSKIQIYDFVTSVLLYETNISELSYVWISLSCPYIWGFITKRQPGEEKTSKNHRFYGFKMENKAIKFVKLIQAHYESLMGVEVQSVKIIDEAPELDDEETNKEELKQTVEHESKGEEEERKKPSTAEPVKTEQLIDLPDAEVVESSPNAAKNEEQSATTPSTDQPAVQPSTNPFSPSFLPKLNDGSNNENHPREVEKIDIPDPFAIFYDNKPTNESSDVLNPTVKIEN